MSKDIGYADALVPLSQRIAALDGASREVAGGIFTPVEPGCHIKMMASMHDFRDDGRQARSHIGCGAEAHLPTLTFPWQARFLSPDGAVVAVLEATDADTLDCEIAALRRFSHLEGCIVETRTDGGPWSPPSRP